VSEKSTEICSDKFPSPKSGRAETACGPLLKKWGSMPPRVAASDISIQIPCLPSDDSITLKMEMLSYSCHACVSHTRYLFIYSEARWMTSHCWRITAVANNAIQQFCCYTIRTNNYNWKALRTLTMMNITTCAAVLGQLLKYRQNSYIWLLTRPQACHRSTPSVAQ